MQRPFTYDAGHPGPPLFITPALCLADSVLCPNLLPPRECTLTSTLQKGKNVCPKGSLGKTQTPATKSPWNSDLSRAFYGHLGYKEACWRPSRTCMRGAEAHTGALPVASPWAVSHSPVEENTCSLASLEKVRLSDDIMVTAYDRARLLTRVKCLHNAASNVRELSKKAASGQLRKIH